jgi:cobalt-precorrin 5A hydrolase
MAFSNYDAVIAVMACGIAVRELAPLLKDKWTDPPVVVVDAGLNHAVVLCGGHHGGNELARRLAHLGIRPVITTATEALGRPSVEGMAHALDCEIVNKDSTRSVNSCLLNSDLPIMEIHGPKVIIVDPDVSVLQKKAGNHRNNHRNGVIVGIGTRRNVSSNSVLAAITKALKECRLTLSDVELFASAQAKEHERGLIEAINQIKAHIVFIPADVINTIQPPSDSMANRIGLTGVCEPAALAMSRENKLIMRKKVYDNVTIAIAR